MEVKVMAIKKGTKTAALFQSMKKDTTYVTGRLDKYLADLPATDVDRAFNVNAPSAIGNCARAVFYGRTGVEKDSNFIEPRTRRIFDNGTYVHVRIQEYLSKEGVLLMDEVPLRNDEFNIQGHTDGILLLDENTGELGVLELKSIKQENFKDLIDAQEGHKYQGLTYLYCLNERREYLRKKYKTKLQFAADYKNREKYYWSLYDHAKDGSKYTRKEKLNFKADQHNTVDKLLFNSPLPLTKVVFIYENKNDQSLKEFVVDGCLPQHVDVTVSLVEKCDLVNQCVKTGKAPNREGKNKSDIVCKWCNWRTECWC